MSSQSGVTCNRCHVSGLGWCVSRSTRKHYLAWLVPTPTVAADGVTVTTTLKPQANLLHKCGETIDQSREQAATYAAARAAARVTGNAQPAQIASQAPQAATVPAKTGKGKAKTVKSTAAVGAVSVVSKNAQPVNAQVLPFKTDGGPVKLETANVPGPVEAAVVMVNALTAKGFPREVAVSLAQTGTPAQLTALLLA